LGQFWPAIQEEKIMKKVIVIMAALACNLALADSARVVEKTAIVEPVSVPRQECYQVPVAVPQSKSGAGALLGAVTGGVIGSRFGQGGGRGAAIMVGAIGGALLGDQIEAAPAVVNSTTTQCRTVYDQTSKIVGYDVVYEYHGVRQRARFPYDPGSVVEVNIQPAVPTAPTGYAPAMYYPQSVQTVPAAVTVQQPSSAAPLIGAAVGMAAVVAANDHHHHHCWNCGYYYPQNAFEYKWNGFWR
jgi:uncharacterized protein YcfJ